MMRDDGKESEVGKGGRTMKAMWAVLMGVVLLMSASVRGEDLLWVEKFEDAKKLAVERNVPILANFSGSDWCGWCKKLSREVFDRSEFKAFAKENVVLFLADFPARKEQPAWLKAQNQKLAGDLGVEGFPTVLLLDAKGKVLARTGYRPGGVEGYVWHIKDLIGKKRR